MVFNPFKPLGIFLQMEASSGAQNIKQIISDSSAENEDVREWTPSIRSNVLPFPLFLHLVGAPEWSKI